MHSEDDDFTSYPASISGNKLASLFEKSNVPAGGNSSLMYKAPKQPRLQKQQQPSRVDATGVKAFLPNNDVNLVLVTTVHSFKLENNEYNSKGKAGAAIVVNSNSTQYQLILYKEKSDIIAQAVINSQFWFTVQPNNYTTFHDKHKIMWSILFESSDSATEFITQIAVAKWISDGKNSLFTQDLVVLVNEESVQRDVFVDITYTVATLSPDNKLDKKVENYNNEQIHISNSDAGVPSWETGLVGMTVGSKRLIMLPGTQSGKWKNCIADSSKSHSILLTVHVNQIGNLGVDKKSSNLDSSVEQNIKAKSESIKDALTSSPNSTRANLISRMAKMGQPTLPFKGARVATSGISDSSETEEDGLSASSLSDSKTQNSIKKSNIKPVPSPPVTVHPSSVPSQQSQTPVTSVPCSIYSQQSIINLEEGANSMAVTRAVTYDGSFMQPGTFAAANFNPAPDPQISVFLSELRTHNSELRMNINRVSDKMDRVADKVDNLDPMNKIMEQLQSVEGNLLSQFSIISQRLIEVNNAMKEKGIRIPCLSSSSLTPSTSGDQLEQLKKENIDLQTSFSQSKNKLNELQVKLDQLETVKVELQKRLAREKENKDILERERSLLIETLKSDSINQNKQLENWQSLADKTGRVIDHVEKKIEEKQKKTSKVNEDDINKIMRSVFKSLLDKFPRDSTHYKFSSSEIHSVLADVIKVSTLEYIQSKTTSYNNNNNNNTVNKEPAISAPIVEESITTDVTTEALKSAAESSVESVKETVHPNSNSKVKETDCKKTLVNQNDLSVGDSMTNDSKKVSKKPEDKVSELQTPFDSRATIVKESGVGRDNLIVKPCVTEFLKMKDEIVKTLESDSQKVVMDKEVSDSCSSTENIREVREQSPCSSVRSSATNDTADENWRSQPPPLLLDEEDKDTDDDWLKM